MSKPPVSPNRTAAKPKASKNQNPSITALRAEFSGPIPPPSLLAAYDELVPGAAQRILAMAESESSHQQHLEKEILRATEAERRRGQNFGLIIGLAGFFTCIVALWVGAYTVAGVIGSTTVLGLVSVFLTGQIIKTKSR